MKAKTDNEKRVWIAEACGAVWSADKFGNPMLIHGEIVFCLKVGEHFIEFHLPDYLNDLNAMHQAEKILSDAPNLDPEIADFTQKEQYVSHLEMITKSASSFFPEITATARQRADALLAVIEITASVGAEGVGQ